jgi:hypothetical protein
VGRREARASLELAQGGDQEEEEVEDEEDMGGG